MLVKVRRTASLYPCLTLPIRSWPNADGLLCAACGTGSREHLVPALALAGRVAEAQEEARLFLAGNPN